ncbi:MAG: hypothetical protein ACYTEZ_11140 [Planctomycetota bacterium]|jgi:hypothetical protein
MLRILSLALVALHALVFTGCRSRVPGYPRNWYAGASFSAIPGVGLAAGGGKVVVRAKQHDWAAEAQIVRHFLDDKDLADDGFGDHGRMTAVRAGFKHSTNPGRTRHVTFRYGFMFYRATGAPGIVEAPGDYFGLYAGVGFETELSRRWTMGPELSLAVLEGEGSLSTEVVPTFHWHLFYNF